MSKKNVLQEVFEHPVTWVSGAIGSVVTVTFSLGVDPISAGSAILGVVGTQATNIFTASSILGFTVAPEIGWLPTKILQFVAIIFGLIVAFKLIVAVGRSIKAAVVGYRGDG